MDIKKAIEFLEDENIYRHFNDMYITQKEFDEYNKSKQQVIFLFQHGEKYEAMWREITSYIMHYNFGNQYVTFREEIRPTIKEIKQKYFPKEIIEEVVKGITEQIKEGAGIAKKERD